MGRLQFRLLILWVLLDRNGFTPITLYFNKECEHRHVQSGVLDVKPEDVIQHGRLEPEKCSL
jgi:hypothetical protein